jgi:hypothetical protein
MLETHDSNKIKQQAFENTLFDADQLKMIEYFADNQKQMTKLIIENLATG